MSLSGQNRYSSSASLVPDHKYFDSKLEHELSWVTVNCFDRKAEASKEMKSKQISFFILDVRVFRADRRLVNIIAFTIRLKKGIVAWKLYRNKQLRASAWVHDLLEEREGA